MPSPHTVIMAGGIGSRFWPLSTPEYPKQFIDILGCGKSLYASTIPHDVIDSSKYLSRKF